LQDLLKAAAAHHLHGEEQTALGIDAQLVDRHDVGVLQLAGDLRLLDEADLLAWVGLVEQVLDGHLAADVAINRAEHGAHAAAGHLACQQVALPIGLLPCQ
jgi:hypothetical protein